jgi:hypothetical protein
VAVATVGFFAVVLAYESHDISVERSDEREVIALLRKVDEEYGLPVAVSHPHAALELSRYAPSAVTANMFALAGPEEALLFTGSDSTERALLELAPLTLLRVERFGAYVASNRPFLVLWTPYFRNWLLPALAAEGRPAKRLEADRGWTVYLVPAKAPR